MAGLPHSASTHAMFEARWIELAGAAPPALSALPATMPLALASLRMAIPPRADISVFKRRIEGDGCERRAEIAGWYTASLKNRNPIGEARIKAILDSRARKICCAELSCPESCPCSYTPQATLGKYELFIGELEAGFLLHRQQVWNCHCLPDDPT